MDIKIVNELAKFNYIKFFDEDHSYYYDNELHKFSISVTEKVSLYVPVFQKDFWASKKAKSQGVTKESILDLWEKKKQESCLLGTLFHRYAENKINNKHENLGLSKNLRSQFDKFYYDSYDKLIPVKSEIVVGDRDLDIAGMIDQIYFSKKLDGLVIFDWKTNKKIDLHNKYQKLLHVFSDLDNSKFNVYSIQLNIYRYLIEKNTNLKIKGLFLGWFNESNDDYKIFCCNDLRDRIPLLFK